MARIIVPKLFRPALEQARVACFTVFRKLPNGPGYHGYRDRLIRRALEDDALLERMRGDAALPPGYGIGMDERCIEYPWAFLHLRGRTGRLLDAGAVLNHEMLVTHPTIARQDLHILTLAPEPDCFWRRGISYLFGDLRDNPIRDGFYDSVVCLSTLEHIGLDNSNYSGRSTDREERPDDFRAAMKELARVLRPGGTLLLTVPFGRRVHHGWLQIFDEKLVEDAVTAFGPAREREVRYFGYTAAGWTSSTPAACADATYTEWMSYGCNHPLWPMREPDDAAAARAVACVRLVRA